MCVVYSSKGRFESWGVQREFKSAQRFHLIILIHYAYFGHMKPRVQSLF